MEYENNDKITEGLSSIETKCGQKRKREQVKINKAKFLVSVPMYVESSSDGESSDEEIEDKNLKLFEFNVNDITSFPYKTFRKFKDIKPLKEDGLSCEPTSSYPTRSTKISDDKSKGSIVHSYIKKIDSEGYTDGEIDPSEIYASFGLNRMYSLSTRNNNSLLEEKLRSETKFKSPLESYNVVSFFWNVQWYDNKNKKVEFECVRSFYKQLKKYDPVKAKTFLKINESAVLPPYQDIR